MNLKSSFPSFLRFFWLAWPGSLLKQQTGTKAKAKVWEFGEVTEGDFQWVSCHSDDNEWDSRAWIRLWGSTADHHFKKLLNTTILHGQVKGWHLAEVTYRLRSSKAMRCLLWIWFTLRCSVHCWVILVDTFFFNVTEARTASAEWQTQKVVPIFQKGDQIVRLSLWGNSPLRQVHARVLERRLVEMSYLRCRKSNAESFLDLKVYERVMRSMRYRGHCYEPSSPYITGVRAVSIF